MSIFGVSDAAAEKVAALYMGGKSSREIADSLHMTMEQVASALVRQWPYMNRRVRVEFQ